MKKNLALVFIFAGVLLIAAAGVVVFGADGTDSAPGEIVIAPEVGAYAPNFSLPALDDDRISLSEFRGKVVLINFWAVWCPPCREEMPAIQQAFEDHNEELVVLSVNAGDSAEDAQKFKEEYGLTFEIALDQDYAVQDLFRVRGLPTSILVDQNGLIQVIHIGFMDHTQLRSYLSDLGLN